MEIGSNSRIREGKNYHEKGLNMKGKTGFWKTAIQPHHRSILEQ